MPIEDAVGELRRCGGTQFDPEVVEGFCDLVNELQSEHDAAIPSAQT
jgi:response regulator RpfG family c-di-GMP phosphodiesterase